MKDILKVNYLVLEKSVLCNSSAEKKLSGFWDHNTIAKQWMIQPFAK